jgi:hypothetical protein
MGSLRFDDFCKPSPAKLVDTTRQQPDFAAEPAALGCTRNNRKETP